MRNYKLLDALEAYLLASKEYSQKPNKEKWELKAEKIVSLNKIVEVQSTTEDIKEMIQDLRDYWETLKD